MVEFNINLEAAGLAIDLGAARYVGHEARAKVDGKASSLEIDVELNHMDSPSKFGGSI